VAELVPIEPHVEEEMAEVVAPIPVVPDPAPEVEPPPPTMMRRRRAAMPPPAGMMPVHIAPTPMYGSPPPPPELAPGTLQIYAPGPPVTVFVDGRRVGQTPLRARVSPGRHRVTIVRDDGTRRTNTVRVSAGRTQNVLIRGDEITTR